MQTELRVMEAKKCCVNCSNSCASYFQNVKCLMSALGFVNIRWVNSESVVMKATVFVKICKIIKCRWYSTVYTREQHKHLDNKKQSIYNKAHDPWTIHEPLNSKELFPSPFRCFAESCIEKYVDIKTLLAFWPEGEQIMTPHFKKNNSFKHVLYKT